MEEKKMELSQDAQQIVKAGLADLLSFLSDCLEMPIFGCVEDDEDEADH